MFNTLLETLLANEWVVFDFDGVLAHWDTGQDPSTIGKPIEGMSKFISKLKDNGYKVSLSTVREVDAQLMDWLAKNELCFDSINDASHNPSNAGTFKPIAKLYIDDRGFRFDQENVEGSIRQIFSLLDIKESTVTHAFDELKRAGLFDKDSDYNGMLGKAVMDLVKVFSKQGHSGFSADMTRELFNKLSGFETLTPITSDPSEWQDVGGMTGNEKPLFQNRRDPSLFSKDGGKTYYDVDKSEKIMKSELPNKSLEEADTRRVMRKQGSITKLFPQFYDRVAAVKGRGGIIDIMKDPKMWTFEVTSGTEDDLSYMVHIQFVNLKKKIQELAGQKRYWRESGFDYDRFSRDVINRLDVKLDCGCPAQLYWGKSYILSLPRYKAKYGRAEKRPPVVRNPKQYGAICKHLHLVLSEFMRMYDEFAEYLEEYHSASINRMKPKLKKKAITPRRTKVRTLEPRKKVEKEPEVKKRRVSMPPPSKVRPIRKEGVENETTTGDAIVAEPCHLGQQAFYRIRKKRKKKKEKKKLQYA